MPPKWNSRSVSCLFTFPVKDLGLNFGSKYTWKTPPGERIFLKKMLLHWNISWWDHQQQIILKFSWNVFAFLKQKRGFVRCWWDDFWSFFQFWRSITPIFDDRFFHHSWICFAIHTNFLGNFDTIRLRYQSEMLREKFYRFSIDHES